MMQFFFLSFSHRFWKKFPAESIVESLTSRHVFIFECERDCTISFSLSPPLFLFFVHLFPSVCQVFFSISHLLIAQFCLLEKFFDNFLKCLIGIFNLPVFSIKLNSLSLCQGPFLSQVKRLMFQRQVINLIFLSCFVFAQISVHFSSLSYFSFPFSVPFFFFFFFL